MKIGVLMAWLVVAWNLAAGVDESFTSANRLFEQGKFKEAAAAYEGILQSGQRSAPIYFNLANAWLKAGDSGRALAAYRQGEWLAPRDPDIQANLALLRSRTRFAHEAPAWLRWTRRLTVDEWSVAAGLATAIWFLLLATAQWKPDWRSATAAWIRLLAIVAAVLCIGAGLSYRDRVSEQTFVAWSEAPVHLGPFDESPSAFNAKPAQELPVRDRRGSWVQVINDAGQVGWVAQDAGSVVAGAP